MPWHLSPTPDWQASPCPAPLRPPAAACIPPNGFYVGGYGSVLGQVFARNFPNYSAGFNLNIPIRNRAAQADWANSELNLRQQQFGLLRLENQVRVEVQNAVIGVQQAQAQYQSAVKQLRLQQETVDAEEKKLAVGASTTYNVILTQRDLVTAESNQVAAESTYAKAKVEVDRATGQTLNNNDISIDEAFRGVVSRPPSRDPRRSPDAGVPRGSRIGKRILPMQFQFCIEWLAQPSADSKRVPVWCGNCYKRDA